jgi:hypothetical protein
MNIRYVVLSYGVEIWRVDTLAEAEEKAALAMERGSTLVEIKIEEYVK